MKKVVFLLFILISFSAKAQNDSTSKSSAISIHLEFSAKTGGGINCPAFNHRNEAKVGYDLTVKNNVGYFYECGFQMAFAGKGRRSLILEPGYSISSQRLNYAWTKQGNIATKDYYGNYKINIQKIELAFILKKLIDDKKRFYINYGIYCAGEVSKVLSGRMESKGYYSFPGVYSAYSSHYDTTYTFNNTSKNLEAQAGILIGLGYNCKLKNGKTIQIDFRVTAHNLNPRVDEAVFRVCDFGLSVIYTFHKTKSFII